MKEWSFGDDFSVPTSYFIMGNGVNQTTAYALNSRGEVTSQTESGTGSNGSSLTRATDYTYTIAPADVDDVDGGMVLSTTVAAGTADAVTTLTNYYGADSDDTGLVSSVISAYGTSVQSKVSYQYDSNGDLATSTDPAGNVTEYVNDNLDRLVEEIDPDPTTGQASQGGAACPTTYYLYDALGNKISETDPNDNTTTYQYDALNRLAKETLPAPGGDTANTPQTAAATTYFYTPAGQVSDVIDALGRDTQSVYDERGELIETIQPAAGVAEPLAISSSSFAAALWTSAMTSAPCTYYAYLCPCQLAVADFLSAGRAGWRGYGLRRVGGGPGAFSAAV